MTPRIIALLNEKGGSGKTTLALNIGAYLASKGNRVLMVDMDPQGHLGKSLGINVRAVNHSTFNLLIERRVTALRAMMPTRIGNLSLIPSNKRLSDFVVNAAGHRDRHLKLDKKLRQVSGFDYVIVDSPPSLGLLSVNILLAVREVIVPVSSTYLALDGCAEVVSTIEMTKRNFKKTELDLSMVVATLYRQTDLADAINARLEQRFGDKFAQTIIHYDVKIDQAQSFGQTIFEFDPESEGARMLARLGEEVIAHGR